MINTFLSKNWKWLIFIVILALGGMTYRVVAAGGALGTSTSTFNNLRQPVANTNGLVGWYPLDGDTKDYSGNNIDGTATNFSFNGSTNGWISGKFGKGMLFNGSNNYILTVPFISQPSGNGNFSTSLWLNFKNFSSTIQIALEIGADVVGGKQAEIVGVNSSNKPYIDTGSGLGSAISPNSISLNTWHLFTSTYDGNTHSLFVDGVLQSTASVSSLNLQSGKLRLGGFAGTSGSSSAPSLYFLNASMDDVRIYNRVLSTNEITTMFAGSPSQSCDQTCKIFLKFDDNTGVTASDSAGNHAGTLNGSAVWTAGNFSSAVGMNGTTDYVSVPDLGITSGTVSLWINPSNISGDQRLFTQASGLASQAGQIALNQSSGENGSLWVYDGTVWQRLSADGTVKVGQWNQVVVSNNGGIVTAYVNGTQALTAGAAFNFNGVPANIGGKFLGTNGGTFNGAIDDFRINARMLAPEEVAEQWRLGT